MARVPLLPLLAVSLVLASVAPLPAAAEPGQQTSESIVTGDSGEALYKTYCTSCHGASGKGDGPLAEHLRFHPADLTKIAKRLDGKFDLEKVQKIIDGREPVKGHGGPDMPVWGDAFKRSGERYSEKVVKDRIRELAVYLQDLQVK